MFSSYVSNIGCRNFSRSWTPGIKKYLSTPPENGLRFLSTNPASQFPEVKPASNQDAERTI